MNTTLDKISHKAQRAAASVIIDKVLAMVDKDREKGISRLGRTVLGQWIFQRRLR